MTIQEKLDEYKAELETFSYKGFSWDEHECLTLIKALEKAIEQRDSYLNVCYEDPKFHQSFVDQQVDGRNTELLSILKGTP